MRIVRTVLPWFRIDRRLLAKHDSHHLDQATQVGRILFPLVKIRKVYFAALINMSRHLNLHVGRRLHVANRRVHRMLVQQPDAYRNVIRVAFVRNGDRAIQIQQFFGLTIVKYKRIHFRK